jgi:hypothetical protein
MTSCVLGFVPLRDACLPLPQGCALSPVNADANLVTMAIDLAATARARLLAGLTLHETGWSLVPFSPRLNATPDDAVNLAERATDALEHALEIASRYEEFSVFCASTGMSMATKAAELARQQPLSGRSWLAAKARHMRSLARQEEEAGHVVRTLCQTAGCADVQLSRRANGLMASLLLPRGEDSRNALEGAARALHDVVGGPEPTFVGPWPPYSFATLEVDP